MTRFWRRFFGNRGGAVGIAIMLLVLGVAAVAPWLYPGDPLDAVARPLLPPFEDARFLLGTDRNGRDIAAGIAHGARVSLAIGITAAAGAILIGTLIGALAGFYRGWIDEALMRLTDAAQTVPNFLLALALVAATLLLADLGRGRNRLGASAFAQVHGQLGEVPPDLDDAALLAGLFAAVQELRAAGLVLAWHDRSDGGLVVTLCEMAFCSRCGLDVTLAGDDPVAALFSEELGGVLQVRTSATDRVRDTFTRHGVGDVLHRLGTPVAGDRIVVRHGDEVVLDASRTELHRTWSSLTRTLQELRDDPACAVEEHDRLLDETDPGLVPLLTFDLDAPAAPTVGRPSVAILREQGVNGQIEMAAAFERAGFDAYDVHVTDVAEGRADLSQHKGVVACGGFSYGDVLGAGVGWAATILYQPRVRDAFAAFFARSDTFALGVCNGCQMFASLREILPGTADWPTFARNRSEVFEGRLSLVRIERSPSILFAGMDGSRLPVPVAHGEGRTTFASADHRDAFVASGLVAARFVDGRGDVATTYPANPNGAEDAITAVTTRDGRVTALMPHPERAFRWSTLSWCPEDWRHPSGDSPWMRLFRNARTWVG